MRKSRGYRWWPAAALLVVAGAGAVACDPPKTGSARASGSAAPGVADTAAAKGGGGQPARYAPRVVEYARAAGIDPQLLMAILHNESYKPHDSALERAWQKLKPDSAFGIANMHKAAFDEAKQGRDFADRDWRDLPDDPDLAIEAAAWHLHDLAAQLPAKWAGALTKNELLALGYNTGAGNTLAFARGVQPGSQASSYLDRLHDNWAKSGKEVQS
ncbi:transglycosylase SLT domain-containing protein [Embleya sp. NPDC005575]|uniref:transglycosylase SLT domain-containing protein n=1 Tax=Embleya sp. NPDC005575 TaxID=3156892 RepID=UPI0033A1A06B